MKRAGIQISMIILLSLILLFCACSNEIKTLNETTIKTENGTEPAVNSKNLFAGLANSIFYVQTFDNQRILEKGKCFVINSNTLVAPFSIFNGANRAVINPLNGGENIEITKYYSYDRINNLILLSVENINTTPLKLYGGRQIKGVKTIIINQKQNNMQPLSAGSCLQEQIIEGRRLFNISNIVGNASNGTPVFVSNGSVLGLGLSMDVHFEKNYFAIPSSDILELLKKNGNAKPLASIGLANATRNKNIKQIILETEFGNIAIRLYNQTPAYRDNFIQLAAEGFYDSLLIHRIIREFGIQMGAADTRHARSDDIVGWKGPGYTLPAHLVSELYHKRGAIGSPRKPDDKNKQRRSDGSQFYIVTGRKYLDEELDTIEKENGIRFTQEQRNIYKNIGGSPHLDGSYTVFGEVVSGIEIADRISMFPTQADFRPITDIRLKKVKIFF